MRATDPTMVRYVLPIGDGKVAELILPRGMSHEQFDYMMTLLDAMKKGITSAALEDDE